MAAAAPALGQEVPEPVGNPLPDAAQPALDAGAGETGLVAAPIKRGSVYFSLAPSLSSSDPLESRLQDFADIQATKLGVKYNLPLKMDAAEKFGWAIALSGEFKRTLELFDSDDLVAGVADEDPDAGPKAAFVGIAKLGWKREVGISPTVSYTFEKAFQGTDNRRDYTDNRLALGFDWKILNALYCRDGEGRATDKDCTGAQGTSLTVSGNLEQTYSSKRDRERLTPSLSAALSVPFLRGITWDTNGTVERRFFDNRVLEDEVRKKRRDWSVLAFTGINISDLVNNAFKRRDTDERYEPVFSDLKLGVRWSFVDSTVQIDTVDMDDEISTFELLPVVTIARKF